MYVRNNKFLTYCTNIHPGESWLETFENLEKYLLNVKNKINNNEKFSIGLRLSNQAATELLENQNIQNFDLWLLKNSCEIITINGFPYGNFHHEKVKENVHKPDWFSLERKNYTEKIIKIINSLKNTSQEVGISTSPIGYKFSYEQIDLKAVKK